MERDNQVMEAGLGTLPYGQPGIAPCANANSKEEFEGSIWGKRDKSFDFMK